MSEFRYVEPLKMSLLRAVRLPNAIHMFDDTGDELVLNSLEARALRDWLTMALGATETQEVKHE